MITEKIKYNYRFKDVFIRPIYYSYSKKLRKQKYLRYIRRFVRFPKVLKQFISHFFNKYIIKFNNMAIILYKYTLFCLDIKSQAIKT